MGHLHHVAIHFCINILDKTSSCLPKIDTEAYDMRNIFISLSLVLVSGCSTVDSVYQGTSGIIGGVASDTFAITSGVLDVTSGVIKDVASKTGTSETEPAEQE